LNGLALNVNRYVKQLRQLASAYRAAETEVIAAFFRRRHSKQDHLRWLSAQAYKEYSAIKPIFTTLARLYPDIDRGIDRREFAELADKLADETKHARLVMDLLEEIKRKKITFDDLLWLPEDKKLAKVRGHYSLTGATLLHGGSSLKTKEIRRKDEALERAAITLTEGGGGALYRVCSKLKRGNFEKRIATVFKEILADETGHKDMGERSLSTIIKTKSAFARAARIITAVSGQRLRMRNEQFGHPLSEAELTTLDERARQFLENHL
jgi:rubrerythrin